MTAVAAEGVWKYYGDYAALRDVEFCTPTPAPAWP